MIRAAALSMICCASPALAQQLDLPSNARMTAEDQTGLNSLVLSTGPWIDGQTQAKTVEGNVSRQAWRISASGLSSLQLIRPLREQLRNDGYSILFECVDRDCGGFDFRFEQRILPPPEMIVNLSDFRYLAAQKGTSAISLIASRTGEAGYVQITRVGDINGALITSSAPAASGNPVSSTRDPGIAADLETLGRAVLSGLTFETGSAKLGPGPFEALDQLAAILAETPERKFALVGHTDSAGSLDGNIALSKRRAASVLERLVTDYGAARSQLEALGMGYLAPVASNLTPDGRDTNRRVEVIITSTQ